MCQQRKEDWLPIPFLEQYEASCCGQIRNKKTGRIKKENPSWNGYMRVQIWKGGRPDRVKKHYRVHRLVAAAWLGDDVDHDVDHIDGNKKNNAVWNLRYLEHGDNVRAYYGNDLSESA